MESVTDRIEKLNVTQNNLESNENSNSSDNSLPLVHTEKFTVTDLNSILNLQTNYYHSDEDTEYTLTALKFSNSWQLFLTYSGNVGTWVHIHFLRLLFSYARLQICHIWTFIQQESC